MAARPSIDPAAARLSHLLRHSPAPFRRRLARQFGRLPPHARANTVRTAARAWRAAPRFSTASASPHADRRPAYFDLSSTTSAAAAMRHQAYIERDSACIHSRGTIADNLNERTRLWSELGARSITRSGHLRAHAGTDPRLAEAIAHLSPDDAAQPPTLHTTHDTHDHYRSTLQRLAEDIDLDGDHGIHSRSPRSSIIQYRIILELPHQLDPHQSAAALDAWCDAELHEHRIAFHAAIHQPEHGNDPRNWHASTAPTSGRSNASIRSSPRSCGLPGSRSSAATRPRAPPARASGASASNFCSTFAAAGSTPSTRPSS